MDDDSLEDQINQTRQNLPARIPEIYREHPRGQQFEMGLRSATVEPSAGETSEQRDKNSASKDRRPKSPHLQYEMSNQAHKLGRAVKGAALSANDLGMENPNALAGEMNMEIADAGFAGATGFVRGLKAGIAAHRENSRNSQSIKDREIPPSDPKAIEAFIAKLPPPPKAIAAPLKQLPPPGRYSGPERD